MCRVESIVFGAEGNGGGGDRNVPVFMTAVELAQMLKMSPRSLEKMRLEKRGPKYFRLGGGGKAKVLYKLDDVMVWLSTHQKG